MRLIENSASMACDDDDCQGGCHALVVSNNIATGIVAAAIVEKCGIIVQRTGIQDALRRIEQEAPSILVVDCSCETLIGQLESLGRNRPFTIYLDIAKAPENHSQLIDVYVQKPLTMDGLQPTIYEWMKAFGPKKASSG